MLTSFYNMQRLLLYFFFLVIHLLTSADSVRFELSRFNTTNMLYQGDAESSDGVIEMNKINYINRVGWATYPERVPIWDSRTGKVTDFSTRFSFSINTQGSSFYGHGLAFFLAPVGFQIPPNSAGGFLGLFNTTTMFSSQNQMVVVEFDSYPNKKEEWDPLFEHVGININSITSAVYTRWNASLHSGDYANASITYNSTTRNLSVNWRYQTRSNPQENSSLSYTIDLSKILPEWVTVGFSAATGSNVEFHQLQSWQFNSSLEITETKENSSKKMGIIVGVAVSACVLIAIAVAAIVISWRKQIMQKKKAEKTNFTSINEDFERGAGPRRFSYKELVSATNNFSNERKLGEGGFGAVYRGFLSDTGTIIAVKKISRGSKQGKKEYITEVKTIGQLRHRNLVQLLGWCHDRGEFILVYEFMPNGSLDSHLFGKNTPLNWPLRYKISIGLASALLYLHEEWEQCVVHRDVKSSNVMLDSNFNVKLGDFGLARLMDHEVGPKTTGLAGTFGYLAPEYVTTRRASKESDVYSFGIVALEIASGRKATDIIEQKSEMSLVEWIWDLYGCENLHVAIDRRLMEMDTDLDQRQVEQMMIVGLWCAHPDQSLRPSIKQALQVLNFECAAPHLPPKMPVPVFHVPAPSVSSGEPSITTTSIEVGR